MNSTKPNKQDNNQELKAQGQALKQRLPSSFRIAISSQSGCGNTTVSTLLADALAVPIINYTFRNLAKERGIAFDDLRRQAEQDDEIDRYVDKHQVELAMETEQSILASRLAVWMLKDADYRVYLRASSAIRGGRVYKREGGLLADRIRETEERDEKDSKRYAYLYAIDNKDTSMCNLVIDTEDQSPEEIVALILREIAAFVAAKPTAKSAAKPAAQKDQA